MLSPNRASWPDHGLGPLLLPGAWGVPSLGFHREDVTRAGLVAGPGSGTKVDGCRTEGGLPIDLVSPHMPVHHLSNREGAVCGKLVSGGAPKRSHAESGKRFRRIMWVCVCGRVTM